MSVKRVAILGSTGSIGRNALRVIEALGPGYEVFALTANTKVDLLAKQVQQFQPTFAAVTDRACAGQLTKLVADTDTEVLAGSSSLETIASMDEVDIVVMAVVGAAGLPAVLAAARSGKRIAVANKEPLVVAGELLMQEAAEGGAEVIPVDSEHSAIFQAMQAGRREDVSKILLTTSGGPFRGFSEADLQSVTLEQALAHPTWAMGPKITIDSATMMNKALEVIEARWLFDTPTEQIEVVVHPESIVHSLVEFVDGSIIAHLGKPDMCIPIQYALTYPARAAGVGEPLSLGEIGRLTFEKPNMDVFRALKLGFEVAQAGGAAAAVFNAANEAAVGEFLARRIKFMNIVELIEHCLDKYTVPHRVGLEELLEADAWARREVAQVAYS